MKDALDRAYEREQDELDRQLANGEIASTEYRTLSRDLECDYFAACDEERHRGDNETSR